MFWKRDRGDIIYVGGKNPLTETYEWKIQVVQVFHRRAGVYTGGGHNLILLMRQEVGGKRVHMKTNAAHAISGSLKVTVRGLQAQLGTLDQVRYTVCYQINRIVVVGACVAHSL